MRRNVKFDDARMDLVLDFCLDPEAGNVPWRKLRPEQARAARVRMNEGGGAAAEIGKDELDDLLGEQSSQSTSST